MKYQFEVTPITQTDDELKLYEEAASIQSIGEYKAHYDIIKQKANLFYITEESIKLIQNIREGLCSLLFNQHNYYIIFLLEDLKNLFELAKIQKIDISSLNIHKVQEYLKTNATQNNSALFILHELPESLFESVHELVNATLSEMIERGNNFGRNKDHDLSVKVYKGTLGYNSCLAICKAVAELNTSSVPTPQQLKNKADEIDERLMSSLCDINFMINFNP